jgi:hypothetical protein
MATSRYPSAAMARGIASQRGTPPPQGQIRSTNASRIIDRRGDTDPTVLGFGPPPLPQGPVPPLDFSPGTNLNPWEQLQNRYAGLRIALNAARNANPGRLPTGGSLYPPGMSMARGGATSGMW